MNEKERETRGLLKHKQQSTLDGLLSTTQLHRTKRPKEPGMHRLTPLYSPKHFPSSPMIICSPTPQEIESTRSSSSASKDGSGKRFQLKKYVIEKGDKVRYKEDEDSEFLSSSNFGINPFGSFIDDGLPHIPIVSFNLMKGREAETDFSRADSVQYSKKDSQANDYSYKSPAQYSPKVPKDPSLESLTIPSSGDLDLEISLALEQQRMALNEIYVKRKEREEKERENRLIEQMEQQSLADKTFDQIHWQSKTSLENREKIRLEQEQKLGLKEKKKRDELSKLYDQKIALLKEKRDEILRAEEKQRLQEQERIRQQKLKEQKEKEEAEAEAKRLKELEAKKQMEENQKLKQEMEAKQKEASATQQQVNFSVSGEGKLSFLDQTKKEYVKYIRDYENRRTECEKLVKAYPQIEKEWTVLLKRPLSQMTFNFGYAKQKSATLQDNLHKIQQQYGAAKEGSMIMECTLHRLGQLFIDQSVVSIGVKTEEGAPKPALFYGYTAASLCFNFPLFAECLMAALAWGCSGVIPYWDKNQSSANDEKQVAIMRFYAAVVIQSNISEFAQKTPSKSFTLEHAWSWLARIGNSTPTQSSVIWLEAFLDTAGNEIKRVFNKQAVKLFRYFLGPYSKEVAKARGIIKASEVNMKATLERLLSS